MAKGVYLTLVLPNCLFLDVGLVNSQFKRDYVFKKFHQVVVSLDEPSTLADLAGTSRTEFMLTLEHLTLADRSQEGKIAFVFVFVGVGLHKLTRTSVG